MQKLRKYQIGDIIAVMIKENKAISCLAIASGIGKSYNGNTIHFTEDQVLWRLGHNKKWPSFVHKAFRGENQEVEANGSGKGEGIFCKKNDCGCCGEIHKSSI